MISSQYMNFYVMSIACDTIKRSKKVTILKKEKEKHLRPPHLVSFPSPLFWFSGIDLEPQPQLFNLTVIFKVSFVNHKNPGFLFKKIS